MRDHASQFHWIKNVSYSIQGLTVNRFTSSPDLEEAAGDDETLISDYTIIPADRSGSSKPELLVADPEEGFHLLLPEEEKVAKHFKDLGELNQDPDVNFVEPLGKIERFSLSANRKLLAIYANQDRGDLIVLKSDLT